MVKNLPAVQGTWVRSLGQENPLEKGMATHSRILAWEILWTEEPGSLQFYNQVTHMISQACYVFFVFSLHSLHHMECSTLLQDLWSF